MGESMKLPGKSLLIFLVVASCVFVVYYFANMAADARATADKKSDLVWLQKILDDRKRPPYRPGNFRSRFDDYDDQDDFWNSEPTTTEYPDMMEPDRQFVPQRQYGQQHQRRPYRPQYDERWMNAKRLPAKHIQRPGGFSAQSSHWYPDEEDSDRSKPFNEQIESVHSPKSYISNRGESDDDNTDWQDDVSASDGESYEGYDTSTTSRLSTLKTTSTTGTPTISETTMLYDDESSNFQAVNHDIKDAQIIPDTGTSFQNNKKSDFPQEDNTQRTDNIRKNGVFKGIVSTVKPVALLQENNKESESILTTKGYAVNEKKNPLVTTSPSRTPKPYRHKWSIDQHLLKNIENNGSKQSSNASHSENDTKINLNSTQIQGQSPNIKSDNVPQEKRVMSKLLNNQIVVAMLKKQDVPPNQHNDVHKDEVSASKKAIVYPKYINVVDWNSVSELDVKPECVAMSTVSSYVRICIHPLIEDPDVSARIRNHVQYEFSTMRDVQLAILQDSNMGLIDLGAGIGEYALAAAQVKRHVVAVEPYQPHVDLLEQSVLLNKLEGYITLVTNVVSDKNEVYALGHNPGHIGDVIIKSSTIGQPAINNFTRSITLNQLAKIIPFKKAVLKMDLPNFTRKALSEADELFDKVDIRYVFTHWTPRDVDLNQFLAGFFQKRGYQPAIQLNGARLRWEEYRSWPYSSIVWQKIA